MTDEEILETYREEIDKNINLLFEKHSIEDGVEQQHFSSAYREGFVEGFRKGYAQGLQKSFEETKNMLRKMHAKGMDIEEIIELTGLTVEEIRGLKTDN